MTVDNNPSLPDIPAECIYTINEENSGEIDEIIMLGKVLAHEVEENSENWDYDLVQEAKSITRKINNRCM